MPIRQKVRPLLLLKKQLGHFQRVGTNTLAIGNRLQGVGTGPGQTGLRALSLAASVGSDDVTVNFNENVVVTDPTSGVSITVNGQAATFGAAKSGNSMVYTLTSQNPIDYDDVIVWTYDSAAAGADPYVGETSGEELADSTLTRTMPAEPPAPEVVSISAPDQNTIVVTFNARVTGSASFGVAWTGLTGTPTAPDPVNINQITYTLDPADAGNIYRDSVITWAYTEATGTLVDAGSGAPVKDIAPYTVDTQPLPVRPTAPVVIGIYAPDQNSIIVTFSDFVSGSATLGVTWNGLIDTPTAPDTAGVNQITYTLGAADAGNIHNLSVITWAYAQATGNLTGTNSGIDLADVAATAVDVTLLPPPATSGITVTGAWGGLENCA